MELLIEAGLLPQDKIELLKDEEEELFAITVSSIKAARKGGR